MSETTEQLIAKVARHEELKPLAKEFESLKKELKPVFEGTPVIQLGEFCVTGEYVTRTRKATAASTYTYWDWDITRGNAHGSL